MTGALDTEMRQTAVDLINEFGKALTIVREEQSYDPAAGETVTTTVEVSVNASPPRDYSLVRIDGTLIQAGDTVVQVAAQGLDLGSPTTPQPTDKVEIDGTRWGIVQIGKVYSGDEIALFTLHLRK